MTNSVGSTSQNVALQPAAARPVDPAVEAAQRQRENEAVETPQAVHKAEETQSASAPPRERPRHVDRHA